MQTDDLIRLLSSDQAARARSTQDWLGPALLAGLAVSAAAFWVGLGPRPDIAAAAATPRFLLKVALALLLAATAAALALRLARPAAAARGPAWAVIAAPALLVLAVVVELALVPPGEWGARLVGDNARICLTAIPALALPLLGAALFALRQGAPTRPALAGAVAGILAGSVAAALYALHCTDDSPLFVAAWYGLGIALVTLVGALAGTRLLRW